MPSEDLSLFNAELLIGDVDLDRVQILEIREIARFVASTLRLWAIIFSIFFNALSLK